MANISVLTGSDIIGNYNTHAIARIGIKVNGSFREYEVPVLTGNSLKHWHSVYLAEVYKTLGGKDLNELCDRGVGLRGHRVDTKLSTLTKDTFASKESEAIMDLCNDIHGFLIPGRVKRDSLVKFSFAAPVFVADVLEATSRYAETHNRVSPMTLGGGGQTSEEEVKNEEAKKEGGQAREKEEVKMMIFKQEYSSSPLYGFNISLNLSYVCKPIYESSSDKICDEEEVKRRKKAAILSILSLLNGFGSKQARALPITEVKELLAVVSKHPIPNVVHGSYEDYVSKSLDIIRAYALTNAEIHVLCYGTQCRSGDGNTKNVKIEECKTLSDGNIKIEECKTLRGLFEKLVSLVE